MDIHLVLKYGLPTDLLIVTSRHVGIRTGSICDNAFVFNVYNSAFAKAPGFEFFVVNTTNVTFTTNKQFLLL
jgi:hypothetical protein